MSLNPWLMVNVLAQSWIHSCRIFWRWGFLMNQPTLCSFRQLPFEAQKMDEPYVPFEQRIRFKRRCGLFARGARSFVIQHSLYACSTNARAAFHNSKTCRSQNVPLVGSQPFWKGFALDCRVLMFSSHFLPLQKREGPAIKVWWRCYNTSVQRSMSALNGIAVSGRGFQTCDGNAGLPLHFWQSKTAHRFGSAEWCKAKYKTSTKLCRQWYNAKWKKGDIKDLPFMVVNGCEDFKCLRHTLYSNPKCLRACSGICWFYRSWTFMGRTN